MSQFKSVHLHIHKVNNIHSSWEKKVTDFSPPFYSRQFTSTAFFKVWMHMIIWWFWLCKEKQFIWRTLHEKQMAYFHPSAELISFIKGQHWNKKKCHKHHCRCSVVTLLFFLFLCLLWSPCLCDFVIGLFLFVLFWRSFPCASSCLLTSSFCSRLALVSVWLSSPCSVYILSACCQSAHWIIHHFFPVSGSHVSSNKFYFPCFLREKFPQFHCSRINVLMPNVDSF